MLTELTLVNFQSHKEECIPLAPITMIVGPSDIGKSAIIRALRLLCLNKPSGSAFVTHGEVNADITLSVDGRYIQRIKGKDNRYVLDGAKDFVSFSTSVPAEIADILQISELNFQLQHDAPFWLSMPPGQVAKELNRIVNLTEIDRVLSQLKRRTTKAAGQIELVKEQLKNARAERKRLAFIKDMSQDFERLKRLSKQKAQLNARIARLSDLTSNASSIAERLDSAVQAKLCAQDLAKRATQGQKLHKRLQQLRSLLSHIESKREQQCQLQEKLHGLKQKLDAVPVCPTCDQPMFKRS